MFRATSVLLLLTACGTFSEAPDPEQQLEIEVEMAETELMIPASEAEMLREEIVALRAETERLQKEIAESEVVEVRQIERHAAAAGRLAAASSELSRLRAELEETKSQLAASEERNQELTIELAQTAEDLAETEEELQETVVVLRRTKEDLSGALRLAADTGWSDLVARSQVALCPKGGKNKMANCRAQAKASIAPLEEVSRACIASGQAAPELRGADKGQDMPSHAVFIGSSDREWFVQLCDPTLPEARALLAKQTRATSTRHTVAATEKRASPGTSGTKRTSYAPPRKAAKPRPTAEPVDLLADDAPTVNGIADLDAADDEGRKETREERKARKEREAAATSRRSLNLSDVGDDLDDI